MPAVEVAHTVTGEGPPLYLVHGIGSRRTTWDALLPALSEHFTCVAYDLRGHGDSPVPPVPYSLDELVDDLEALRVRLGHERIHVMGHSLGGQIGPAYARAHPARTSSVVLLSTAAGRTVGDSAGVKGVVAAMRDQGVEAVLTTLVDRWYTDGFIAAHPEVIEHRIEQVLGTPEDVFLSVFDVYASTEMLAWLPQVGCPCLVLTGEFDGACNPRLNAVIDDALPESELVVLPALKHSVLVEGPERVLPPVLDFLLRHRDC
ncbi:MAG TPA: alpha/beta fold hydrolase [Acidimicrobiales bacterium]|jgi:pimeloyl-ACP methyl ester carboxylesterase|nr:alpha/beta fold hydrolase [Actinomycetes bacterium]MDP6106679.1 alpha/beta fold hydrolase [Acidimicrobiales bacterium]MCP4845860.1 alpha/beta fold hydrolase [Actinomycetes bacterium]MDP6239824.1 alpha/beta fold hydrolase [Acidimicrobiales bacterium]MDP7124954.1 alpha/beta fold hydrolase [Acidimicrobiales bacterium]|tara:strand:+ start:2460 stop:3239 length:780 start_codon:yes stop_codon:yes gene_type:complete